MAELNNEERCDLIEICEKAGTMYYRCVRDDHEPKCSVAEQKIISLLSSINEKLEKLLITKNQP